MSWMKRGQAGAGPGAQPYAAPQAQAQPFGNQQTMYPNFQGGTAPPQSQPPQQFWQPPPQQPPPPQPPQQAPQQYNHSLQYGQPYSQDYPTNANQYQAPAQTQYNQNYTNQYANPQQNYPQNFYQNQTPQNYAHNVANTGTTNADGWDDNWDWGWDENAKKAQGMQNMPQQLPVQLQVTNNANVIEESFASTDSWNWAMDEKKDNKAPAAAPPIQGNNGPPAVATHSVENHLGPETPQNNMSNQQAEEVKTLSDREAIKERLPNLALGKRFNLENLTPQWSIESQMSQESSDGPQTLSEGTYRSDNQSRNSGESPGPNMDSSNFNYAQSGFDETYTQNSEWSKNSDEPTVADGVQNMSRQESHEELSSSLHEMSLTNDNNPTNSLPVESRNIQENLGNQLRPASSPTNFPAPASNSGPLPSLSMPPPPPISVAAPQPLPRPPSSSSTSSLASHSAASPCNPPQPPQPSAPASLPPSNSQNPFQRAGPFSHKPTGKSPAGAPPPFQPQMSSNLASPAVVSKASQGRGADGFEANLETTPDNSERPDQPQVLFRQVPAPQPIPDNLEVAPQNDRNEYLQTAHLSSGDYGENTDFSRNLPPPGLRRMVVGQQEPEYRSLGMAGDEPPPGLARMVPGQQTEAHHAYSQPADNYLDRHIDGQPTDAARPFRQADGQQNAGRAADRRALGFDRMVPGEPSNDEYSQYQGSYATNEPRVVTGVDRDFHMPTEAGPPDVREQNMDGSDYTEPPRNVMGARDAANDSAQEFAAPDDAQREVTVEGENLQDLSAVSSADLTCSREQLDGADQNPTDAGADRNDASDSLDRPAASSRRHSLNRVNTSGDDSERDRAFRASPRRDRHKSSRDRDRDRNRDRDKEGRYLRSDRNDRKYDNDEKRRDEKRTDKDRRDRERAREGAASPDARKLRRSTRSRKYDEDDTDYYSDKERDRRRYREGSYTSKPPRPEERERRYHTAERERRDRPRDPARRDRDRYDRHYADYRDIDPSRKYGNLHREREDDRRRVTFSTDAKSNESRSEGESISQGSRPDSREAGVATDEDGGDARRSQARARRPRRARADPYYDGYGSGYQDPYRLQRQQYEYYSELRARDPAAYMLVYKQLMAGHAPPPAPAHLDGYGALAYDAPERGSVHSGRSSAAGHKPDDTFYVHRAARGAGSLRDAPSLRTDVSDRDLTTDASLGLQLEESTVRSERMTPFRFSTAHVKASISSRDVVLVPAAYPVDGAPATVQLLALGSARAHDPDAAALLHAPGPLVKGVTHKKSVIEYCMVRVRNAAHEGAQDVVGYVLLWELLALMLRQNGVVVGTDIAELLMSNTRSHPARAAPPAPAAPPARAAPASERSASPPHDCLLSDATGAESASPGGGADERAALDKFRDYLLYGNRQEALEWAMSNNLWGHALQLAAGCDRRLRAGVASRFLAAIPRADPLHTLYAALAHTQPPVCTGAGSERWGEWRTHAAVLLANATQRPDDDARALTTLGDSLHARGLWYSAQLCYVAGGVQCARHPLAPLPPGPPPAAPPRLALLLAPARPASLAALATTHAILATEIYEYAHTLNNDDYVIHDLQVYKLVMACRLVDAGQYERALAYVEAAARAVTRQPAPYSPRLVRALAELADRLKYHDPALLAEGEDEGSAEGSPRHHQWRADVAQLAMDKQVQSAPHASPQHAAPYAWEDQAQQYQQSAQTFAPPPAEAPAYSQYYQPASSGQPEPYAPPPADQYAAPAPADHAYADQSQPAAFAPDQPAAGSAPEPSQDAPHYPYEDWGRTEETHSQSYGEPYWAGDNSYGYGENGAAERPTITMPGGAPGPQAYASFDDDSSPSAERSEAGAKSQGSKSKEKEEAKPDGKARSWIGGILGKLALRPPNQMILPDDKNPTIVWDADAKCWRNTDGSTEDAPPPRLPPPAAGAPPNPSPPLQPGGAASPPVSNIFKMQKGRHIKKSYVDVFNPGGATERARPPAADVLGPAPTLAPAPAYFVPSPQGYEPTDGGL